MIVKIKKLSKDAVIPSYSKDGDAGMDLTCISAEAKKTYTEYDTGLSIEIPEGYVGLVFPRSSISEKAQSLANAVGVIDSGYRGPIKVRFKCDMDLIKGAENFGDDPNKLLYIPGDRVAQLIILPYPQIEFEEVKELNDSARGEGGFGSTDKLFKKPNL